MKLEAGATIDRYRIVEKIGEGGMGVVWRAVDTRLDRDVVLKLLPAHLAGDRERLARFEREARAVASLNHPNIVTLYSVEEAGGIPFLTMERIEGRSLSNAIPDDGLALGQFFDVAIALADAVAAAHERGVTHRDLKPANVMVTDEGRVKVLDFGLAKLAEPEPDPGDDPAERPTRGLTEAGLVLGTVSYMSPEQVRGDAVDHRSDIFSLGIVLYEMATGRRPFTGSCSADVISALLRDTPTAIHEIKPELPGHLGRIVRACLEKDPDRRYQSAKDLRNALEDLKIEVSTGSWRRPAAAAPRRRPGARVLAGAAMVVAVAALLSAVFWLGGDDRPSITAAESVGPSVAVLPFENLSPDPENAYFAEGMTEELIGRLVRVPGLKVPARTTVAAFRDDEGSSAERIGRALGVRTVLEGSVRKQGDRLRISAQLIDASNGFTLWSDTFDREMRDVFAIQDEIAQAIADNLKLRLAQGSLGGAAGATENVEAYNLYLQGRFLWNQRTEASLMEAIDRFERAIEADPRYAPAHAGLADSWAILPGYADVPGDEAFPKARDHALKALELDPDLAEAHTSLAMVLWSFDHDLEAAEREYRRALALDPDYATAHQWLALLLSSKEDGRDEALTHLRRAEELDPLSRIIKLAYASELIKSGNFDGGIEKMEELRRLDPDYPAHEAMAWAYLTRQRFDDAIAVLEEGLRRSESSKVASYLASLYHARGRYDDELALAAGAPDAPFAPLARLRATVASAAPADDREAAFDDVLAAASRMAAYESFHAVAELAAHGEADRARRLALAVLDAPPPSKYDDRPDPWRALGLARHALFLDRLDEAEQWSDEALGGLDGVPGSKAAEVRSMAASLAGRIAVRRGDRDAVDAALHALSLDGAATTGQGMRAFARAEVLAEAGRDREALSSLDRAFVEGFAEPLALHASSVARKLSNDPSFRARLELYGLR